MRGLFLRGYGAQTSSHYGSVVHQSGELGMIQGDAIRNITGGSGDSPNSGAYYYGALAGGAGGARKFAGEGLRGDLLSILTPARSFLRPLKTVQ